MDEEMLERVLTKDIIEKSEKNCLIIKTILETQKNILSITEGIFNKDSRFVEYYQITDCKGDIKYKGKYKYDYLPMLKKFKTDTTMVIELYDSNNQKRGYIESVTYKNIKMCSVYNNDKRMLDIKRYEGSNEIDISLAEGNFKVDYNQLNTYEIKVENKQIGKLYIVQTQKEENYLEKYVLEYEDEENEILGILLSMAIDRISYENENEK